MINQATALVRPKKRLVILALMAALHVSACGSLPNTKSYQGAGKISGAVSGSYIGHLMARQSGALTSGLGGAYVGFNIIRLFASKRNEAIGTFNRALEYNKRGLTTSWQNRHDWTSGSYTPMGTIRRPDGMFCRQVLETTRINNQMFQNTVLACRHGKEDWRVVPQSEMAVFVNSFPSIKNLARLVAASQSAA